MVLPDAGARTLILTLKRLGYQSVLVIGGFTLSPTI